MSSPNRKPITAFDGAISTLITPDPTLAFAFEITFHLHHPHLISLSSQKPPLHFHPWQAEYIKVLEGRLCVEMAGHELLLTPNDGEICIRPWEQHRLYPPPYRAEDKVTRFLLSGAETAELFRLDEVFFTNWYRYQDEVVLKGRPFDVVQVMAMFDAGGSYLSLPWWVPFGRTVSRVAGIVIGRWLGALLGYQPFYRKWTMDWHLACLKMEASWLQRRFADRSKMD